MRLDFLTTERDRELACEIEMAARWLRFSRLGSRNKPLFADRYLNLLRCKRVGTEWEWNVYGGGC